MAKSVRNQASLSSKGTEGTIPCYVRPPTRSCHEYCKYGGVKQKSSQVEDKQPVLISCKKPSPSPKQKNNSAKFPEVEKKKRDHVRKPNKPSTMAEHNADSSMKSNPKSSTVKNLSSKKLPEEPSLGTDEDKKMEDHTILGSDELPRDIPSALESHSDPTVASVQTNKSKNTKLKAPTEPHIKSASTRLPSALSKIPKRILPASSLKEPDKRSTSKFIATANLAKDRQLSNSVSDAIDNSKAKEKRAINKPPNVSSDPSLKSAVRPLRSIKAGSRKTSPSKLGVSSKLPFATPLLKTEKKVKKSFGPVAPEGSAKLTKGVPKTRVSKLKAEGNESSLASLSFARDQLRHVVPSITKNKRAVNRTVNSGIGLNSLRSRIRKEGSLLSKLEIDQFNLLSGIRLESEDAESPRQLLSRKISSSSLSPPPPPTSSSAASSDHNQESDDEHQHGHAAAHESRMLSRRSSHLYTKELELPVPKLKLRKGSFSSPRSDTNAVLRRMRFKQANAISHEKQEGRVVERGRSLRRRRRRNLGFNASSSTQEPTPQTVVLRHQNVQTKKDTQDYNRVIEETASKLVETRKSKVKALVGAFETVISLQESKPVYSETSSSM